MFVGTGSDVGKSILTTAFCRILKQDGFSPAPFKAQNMSLNSYPTADGREIGRAQAVQAEASGIPCSSDMNPVLLKPSGDTTAQVILHGRPIGNRSAKEYFNGQDRAWLFDEAMSAFDRLASSYDPIVIEGAGSISELNLRDRDIVNMSVALRTQASVFLIADIDRGGVFGSIYGTLELLPPEERRLIRGIFINRFRGDMDLFADGRRILERITGLPVLGVIPYLREIGIDQEDSLTIEKTAQDRTGALRIAVLLLPHMSNFTDFNVLERHPDIHLYYAAKPDDLDAADILILPGSKNTIADLLYLRRSGMASALLGRHAEGASVYGICGGYQMMGLSVHDPHHVEGDISSIPGLALLPVTTELTTEKRTEQVQFRFREGDALCKGYEIHMGVSVSERPSALCRIGEPGQEGRDDGYFESSRLWGTYIHGIFDNEPVIDWLLKEHSAKRSAPADDPAAYREKQYDRLADHVRKNTDMELFYGNVDFVGKPPELGVGPRGGDFRTGSSSGNVDGSTID